nr:MAG TPA: hypothetical protein [Caudoviricetes sp.]
MACYASNLPINFNSTHFNSIQLILTQFNSI